jgi:hypothetical protein
MAEKKLDVVIGPKVVTYPELAQRVVRPLEKRDDVRIIFLTLGAPETAFHYLREAGLGGYTAYTLEPIRHPMDDYLDILDSGIDPGVEGLTIRLKQLRDYVSGYMRGLRVVGDSFEFEAFEKNYRRKRGVERIYHHSVKYPPLLNYDAQTRMLLIETDSGHLHKGKMKTTPQRHASIPGLNLDAARLGRYSLFLLPEPEMLSQAKQDEIVTALGKSVKSWDGSKQSVIDFGYSLAVYRKPVRTIMASII